MKNFIYLSVILLLSAICAAARNDIKFEHVGLSRGLSHSTVTAIAQDPDGYLWVGTPDGLNRYDGYGFRTYRHDSSDRFSPAFNAVSSIRFCPGGNMWLAGENALSRYDAYADRFENHFLGDDVRINDIMPVDSLRLLVATTAGLFSFNIADTTFTSGFGNASYTRPVALLNRDGDDVYMSCGNDGLKKLDIAAGRIADIRLPGKPYVGQTFADGDALYIATEGSGLLHLDRATGKIHAYRAATSEGLRSDYVRSIARDADGRLWVGTFGGLDIFDADKNAFRHFDADPDTEGNLSHSSVRQIFTDRQNGIWLGTFFGGLNYYHPLRNQFRTMRRSSDGRTLNDNVIGTMCEDDARNIWIGTNNGGINVYNRATGKFRHYTVADGLGSNDVKAIYPDKKSDLVYVGSHLGGLDVIDRRTGHITHLSGVPDNVYAILPAKSPGQLWVATLDNLVLYDIAGKRSTIVPANGLHHITDLYRDRSGLLWVSGEDGVTAFNEDEAGNIEPAASVSSAINGYRGRVNNVCMSRSGNTYYISTMKGLLRYDADNGQISSYTTADGLPNDIVYGVLEDADGKLWCSTNFGLARLNPANGSVVCYKDVDGLQSNQFALKSFLRSSDGYMYFGGVNGLTYFNPSILKSNSYAPQPTICGLRMFNRPVTPGDDTGILRQAVSKTDRISLSPGQTALTIDFTVCNYVAGGHNTFSYKLEGLDKEWNTTDAPRPVTYSNLQPGDYRFLLRAANNDGLWSEKTTSLDITVLPRWYQRWWVRALFILLVLSAAAWALVGIWRRRERERREQMNRLNASREKELSEMKIRFFINMSHELRTPLTLILLPVQELLQRATDSKTAQRLNLIKNNADKILRIVNQLLDYRRAEMGMFKLQTEPVKINELVYRIFSNYEYQATRRGIDYHFSSSVPDKPVMCDSQYIELICNNLISNAFKYTPKGQSITVTLSEAGNDTVCIVVADTGCGIPSDKLPEIFTRFYKIDDRVGGSGIGLSLVKRLVELHHGTIEAASELGSGTTFTVTLPVGETEYSAEERRSEAAALPVSVSDTQMAPLAIPDSENEDTDSADTDIDSVRETVMVVDDNPDILKYICENLAKDYNVLPAADGAKAIRILSENKVDLIITDIMMPDIDGVQLCRAVKRNLRTSHIPVVMLSAKNDAGDYIDGLKVGADDYIGKPFSMDILAQKVRNLLRTRRQTIQHFSDAADVKTEVPALNPLDEDFLKKAMDTMEKYLDDSEFTTDRFANEMCMSRSNLHLKMKALTGESTNDFIRRFRMRRAMEFLKSGRYNISQVSAMVGYSTPSYFATSFKKFYGDLPSSFIKND